MSHPCVGRKTDREIFWSKLLKYRHGPPLTYFWCKRKPKYLIRSVYGFSGNSIKPRHERYRRFRDIEGLGGTRDLSRDMRWECVCVFRGTHTEIYAMWVRWVDFGHRQSPLSRIYLITGFTYISRKAVKHRVWNIFWAKNDPNATWL